MADATTGVVGHKVRRGRREGGREGGQKRREEEEREVCLLYIRMRACVCARAFLRVRDARGSPRFRHGSLTAAVPLT